MRPEKTAIVSTIKGQLDGSDYVLLVDYRGLTVEQLTGLRSELRGAGAICEVVKNSFLDQAAGESGWKVDTALLDGPTAMITGAGDVLRVAKVLKTFSQEAELPKVKGGRLGERALSAGDVAEIALIPSREVMLGRLVGTVAAPVSQLAGVLKQKVLSLLYVLKAVEDQKDKGK